MDNVVCPLCLYFDPEIFGDFFVVAVCGHMFHKQCILKILQRSMNQCPLGCAQRIEEQTLRRVYGVGSSKSVPSSRKSSENDLNVPSSNSPTPGQNFIMNLPLGLSSVDYSFKIVLLGEPGVGKTSLIRRFSDNTYNDAVNATPGVDLVRKVINIGGCTTQLIIWDTAGQETYRSIIPACVRDVQGIIFVYDITNLDSFHSVASWVNFANKNGPSESIKILVGNKSDQEAYRSVDPRCGKMTADIMKISFFETSAKDSVNVEAVFRAIGAKILESEWILANEETTWQQNSICLHDDPPNGHASSTLDGLFRNGVVTDDLHTPRAHSPSSKLERSKCADGKCAI
ncbi:GTP-binding protein YPT1 [Orchesella cincta]|uniref:GTP-binding protein YPT1 n=1 Tax=Orchesella cincta TaxID=48709 RepID=A0A1D2MWR4_ORCCI|nr:GTP-binding protein YPT1 [Orchesella cincta]